MNLIFNLFLLFFSTPVLSDSIQTKDGILLDAENTRIQADGKFQKIFLSNDVQIIYQGQHISCDEAYIDTKNKTVTAKGKVNLVSADAKLESDGLFLNYETNTGEIYNGYVRVGQVTFQGEKIIKTGDKEYETFSGKYTSCQTCPEAWSISGSKVNAEIGGYAYIKNSVIRFSNVPFIWLPYLIVPLKSERQTGLLFPDFAYSNESGFIYSQSLFWAASDNTDFTFTGKNYAKRGTKALINHRYVLSTSTRGSFDVGYLQDKVFSNSEIVNNNLFMTPSLETDYNPTDKTLERWFAKYHHHFEMPYNFSHNLDINIVSDTLYPKDFQDEIEGRGDPALESRTSITKNTDNSHFSVDATYFQDLLKLNPLGDNKNSVHKFPEVNYILSPYRLLNSNLMFNFEANYVNFSRDNFTYDDLDSNKFPLVDRDGKYDTATDLIRTGQRLDVEPSLDYNFKIGDVVDIIPSLSYRETRYNFSIGEKPSTYRRFARTNLAMKSDFSGVFGDLENPNANRFKHIITPEVSYSTIPWIDQPAHPFFGTTDDDNKFNPNFKRDQGINNSDLLQFDYEDRLYEKNLVTFSISNKLIRKRVRYSGGPGEYKQVLVHRLSQSFDFHEDSLPKNTQRQPWSEITSLLDLRLDNFETNSLIKYLPYQNTVTSSSRFKLFNDRGDFVQVTYSSDKIIQTPSSIQLTSRTEDLAVGGGVISKYFNLGAETTFNLIKSSFEAYKYFLKLKPPGNCWAITFVQERPKDNESTWKLNVSFLFDGKTETTF